MTSLQTHAFTAMPSSHDMLVGPRLLQMTPSGIRAVHEYALGLGRSKEDLCVHIFGESDEGTPDFIVEAGVEALRNKWVFYSANGGHHALVKALVEHYQEHLGLNLSAENFVVTCGGVQAILLVMLGTLTTGDDAIVITPAWPNTAQAVTIAGANLHSMPLHYHTQTRRFILDFDALERLLKNLPNPRLIAVNTPSNPTGYVMPKSEKERLLAVCKQYDLMLLADEIYDRIQFVPSPSFLQLQQADDAVIAVNGFSKTYAMTGWRLGYLIAPSILAKRLAQMQEFFTSCAPAMAQAAAIHALEHGEPYVQKMQRHYQQLGIQVTKRLETFPGVEVARTDGAFYTFFRGPGSADSVAFCKRLVRETGVVIAPGIAFGQGGEGWVRMCFAKSQSLLEKSLSRLEAFFA